MNQAHSAKQRIIERNRYQPNPNGERGQRKTVNGMTQTFKRVGDLIIDSRGKKTEVTAEGWQ